MSTVTELRKKYVDYAKKYKGCKQGSKLHRQIIDIFNTVKPDGWKMTYNAAWCAAFVSGCAIACKLNKAFPLSANVGTMIEKAKKAGTWVENDAYKPTQGDLIVYDWQDSGKGDNKGGGDHVGIVTGVKNGVITVIEGNKGTTKMCDYREIKVNGKYIRGFIVPKYSIYASASNDKKTTTKKSNSEIAKEVIAGKWGNGSERTKKLKAAGYDPESVQKEVNKLLSKNYKTLANMNVRNRPTLQGKILKLIPKGTKLTAEKITNNWLYDKKQGGWICIKDNKEKYCEKI